MAYVPQNVTTFVAALSGGLAGMGASGRIPNSPVIASYDSLVLIASAYAQAVDITWGAVVPTLFEETMIGNLSFAVWEDRAPQLLSGNGALDPATCVQMARALIAQVKSGDNYLTSQGIVPPPVGGLLSLTATLPLTATAGHNPNIAINPATALATGSLTLAGDLNGTGTIATAPRVGSLTGVAGVLAVAATAALVQWAAATVTPTISQVDTGNATGATLAIKAQNALTTGGKAVLSSGTGVTAGNVELQLGGVAKLTLTPSEAIFVNPLFSSALDAPPATTLQLGTTNATAVTIGLAGRFTNVAGAATIAATLGMGVAPAATGIFRVSTNFDWYAHVNGADKCVMAIDDSAGNSLVVGMNYQGLTGFDHVYVAANNTGEIFFSFGDTVNALRCYVGGGSGHLDFYQNAPGYLFTRTAQDLNFGVSQNTTLVTLRGDATAVQFNVPLLVGIGSVATGITFGSATTSVTITQAPIGNGVAAITALLAQSAVGGASVGGDLQLGGGTGNINGFVDFRNQALGTGGATVAGGTLLTGLLAKTIPIKVNGVAAYVLCLT